MAGLGGTAQEPLEGYDGGADEAEAAAWAEQVPKSLADAQTLDDLCWAISRHIFERRVRLRDGFLDFDPLRTGRVTRPQFCRALSTATLELTPEQQTVLVDAFTDARSQNVDYATLCDQLDRVFAETHLEKQPLKQPAAPGELLPSRYVPQPLSVDEGKVLAGILHKVALLNHTRRLIFTAAFADFERSAVLGGGAANASSNASVYKAAVGCVTEPQFLRVFPFTKEMSQPELALLVRRYRNARGEVNYRALADDVSEVKINNGEPPFPSSPLVVGPDDGRTWTCSELSAEQRIQAKVIERRLRLRDFFLDFDPLRKGFCTVSKLVTVFGILGLEVSAGDLEELTRMNLREDGMFMYASFCDRMDSAFTLKGLEAYPEVRLSMTDASSTEPARRNYLQLSAEEAQEIDEIENDIRSRIACRQLSLITWFQSFDRTRSFQPLRGQPQHVSKSQFARVLSSLGVDVSPHAIHMLSRKYCDLGNLSDVNYAEFCASVDPPRPPGATSGAGGVVEVPAMQTEDRRMKPDDYFKAPGSKYFDRSGVVIPFGQGM